MCRDNNHGGRRCPNDTSEARRLRRANATAKARYRTVAAPLKESEYLNPEPEISTPDNVSIETINTRIQELQDLKKYQNDLQMRLPNGNYKIDLTPEERLKESKEIVSKLEQKVIEIGAEVNTLAQKRTGFTDELMQTKLTEAQKPLLDKFDKLETDLASFKEELTTKYQHYDPDTPYVSRLLSLARQDGNETAEDDYKKLDDLNYQVALAKREAADAARGQVEEVTNMLIANAKEYRNVLAEVRPLGGEIKIAENSASKEAKLMKEVAEVYPTAWIEASNNSNSLRIKKTTGRAHYNHSKAQITYSVQDKINLMVKPKDWEPDEHDRWESGWTKLPPGVKEYVDPKTGYTIETWADEDEIVWVAPRFEYFDNWTHRSRDGVPVGPGWKKVTIRTSEYNPETRERTEKLVETYRRVQKRKTRSSWGNHQAELTIDGESSRFGSKGYPTALHEFAHRVEKTGPAFIHEMQTEFLRRRTTDSNGVQEPLQQIYPKKKEFGRFDNFPDKYMGKEYAGSVHHEILSTGAEAVFAGKFGGLAGVGTYKPDSEMKNFILGLWASA